MGSCKSSHRYDGYCPDRTREFLLLMDVNKSLHEKISRGEFDPYLEKESQNLQKVISGGSCHPVPKDRIPEGFDNSKYQLEIK